MHPKVLWSRPVAALGGILALACAATPGQAVALESPSFPTARVVLASPVPGATLVLPQSDVLLRFDRAIGAPGDDLPGAITAVGSASGPIAGRAFLADGGRALLFRPVQPFAPGERVRVTLATNSLLGPGRLGPAAEFAFTVAARSARKIVPALLDELGAAPDDAPRPALPSRASPPTPDGSPIDDPAPPISSTINGVTAPGSVFMSNFAPAGGTASDPHLLVVQDDGTPIFSRAVTSMCADFKQQPSGLVSYYDSGAAAFFTLDRAGAFVSVYRCGNGYYTDVHDLRLLPNAHALLMAYDPEPVDMSAVVPGGDPNAIVTGLVIQELDERGNVVFQWRSWDHFQITDATHVSLTASNIDYCHGNALDVDTDGNLLLSSRHMDEITKIDRTTGDVIWRLGGKHNQFTFTNDTLGFSYQHAIRRIANGDVTLFDNGDFHPTPFSRAVEYALDENAHTATLVWQYRRTPDSFGVAMGYVQRLDNGNTLIGWGFGKPDVSEVAPDGTTLLEMSLPAGMSSYRSFRYDWSPITSGAPPRAPVGLALAAATPNPFHGRTRATLSLPGVAPVSMRLYDLQGREVRTLLDRAPRGPGLVSFAIDLTGEPAGVYFCRAQVGDWSATRRLLLLP